MPQVPAMTEEEAYAASHSQVVEEAEAELLWFDKEQDGFGVMADEISIMIKKGNNGPFDCARISSQWQLA